MADIAITPSPLGQYVSYRQKATPAYFYAEYSTKNTNNNDIRFPGKGKGRFSLNINNAPNQDLTKLVYGMHTVNGAVGDDDVFEIVATANITQGTKSTTYVTDKPFPWYLVRLTHAVQPTDSPAKSVKVWIDLAE